MTASSENPTRKKVIRMDAAITRYGPAVGYFEEHHGTLMTHHP